EYRVEKILRKRFNCEKNRFEYRIKWEDWPSSENTWEPEENLDCPDRLRKFEKRWKKKKNKLNKAIPISEFIVKDGTDKRKRKRSKETDDDFIVSDEDDAVSDDDDFIVSDDDAQQSESDSSATESEASSNSADSRCLKKKPSRSSRAEPKKLTIRMKALHREDLKRDRRASKSKERRWEDQPGTSRQSSTDRRQANRKSGGARESRYQKYSVPETSSEESDSEVTAVQKTTPAKKKKVIHDSDDDQASEPGSVQPTPRKETKRVVISDSESDGGAHDVAGASDAMNQLSVDHGGNLEEPADVQNDEEENIQDANMIDEEDDDEVLGYEHLPDVSFEANQPLDEERAGEASENLVPQVADGTVPDSPETSEAQPEGIPYVELLPGEPNGFDKGWKVEVVHDIIRGPNGGQRCIVKFEDQPNSQMIEAGTVLLKAPKELLIMLHKKIGVKL
ncbi:heterochromatin-associated protein, partial [Aphelenchoides avenae]